MLPVPPGRPAMRRSARGSAPPARARIVQRDSLRSGQRALRITDAGVFSTPNRRVGEGHPSISMEESLVPISACHAVMPAHVGADPWSATYGQRAGCGGGGVHLVRFHSTSGGVERALVSRRAEPANRRWGRRAPTGVDAHRPTCRSDAKIGPSLCHPTRP